MPKYNVTEHHLTKLEFLNIEAKNEEDAIDKTKEMTWDSADEETTEYYETTIEEVNN